MQAKCRALALQIVLCSNNLCFKAWVYNLLSVRLYYAARCQFVNDVSYTKITEYFKRLGIPFTVILPHAALEQANNKSVFLCHKMFYVL